MSDLQQLSTLTFAQRINPSPDIGEKGDLRWIPLSKLRVDPVYQRAILDNGKANVRRMIEGFSWLLFGVVVVAERPGGLFAIIDGQHRATAARHIPTITSVPCLVVRGGLEAEARAFSAINGNVTRVHTLQRFRALVAAGDVPSKALATLCEKAGVSIAAYPKMELAPGETMGLGALRLALKNQGEAILVNALGFLRELDKDAGISAAAITGTCAVFHQHPDLAAGAVRLARKVAQPGKLSAMGEKARSRRASRGGTEWSNFGAVVVDTLTMAARAGGQDMKRLMAGR